ncbi:MAG: pyrimidine reductase family protein [Acidimicrobiales bacterium]
MIRLFPVDDRPAETIDARQAVALEARPRPSGRPWVYTNMIASADGGTAVDGLSGQLGGPGDKAMFGALRAIADVILVGASTVRAERYRPPNLRPESVAMRRARGQADHPRLVVVSRSLSIDLDLPLFDDPDNRPFIVTTESSPIDKRTALEQVADIIIAGQDGVSLQAALSQLASTGVETVLSEGGPSINGQLIDDGLIDEWNLSISPRLLGGDSRRAAIGPLADGPPLPMTLSRVWTDNDLLFCRWVRSTTSDPDQDA